jgi:hypothetical protein
VIPPPRTEEENPSCHCTGVYTCVYTYQTASLSFFIREAVRPSLETSIQPRHHAGLPRQSLRMPYFVAEAAVCS